MFILFFWHWNHLFQGYKPARWGFTMRLNPHAFKTTTVKKTNCFCYLYVSNNFMKAVTAFKKISPTAKKNGQKKWFCIDFYLHVTLAMYGSMNIAKVIMNSSNALVQLMQHLFKRCKKNNILAALY